MILTKSNVLLGKTPTVVNGFNSAFDAKNTTDPDFSTFYTSTDNNRLTLDFGAVQNINYVAYAGLNISGAKDFTSRCRVRDGATIIASTFISFANCVVVTFPTRSFSNLRIGMFNSLGNTPPSVRFVAAGLSFTVPNSGEVAGYNRQFLNRNRKTVSSLNNLAAPTSYLINTVAAKGTLRVPNVTRSFSENQWQEFLDFSSSNYFFVREQDPVPTINAEGENTNNDSAYLCFEPTGIKTTAHAQTRALNNLSISFKVFTGL